jgi:hypothetical protein
MQNLKLFFNKKEIIKNMNFHFIEFLIPIRWFSYNF